MNQCDIFGLNFDAGTLEGATISNSHLDEARNRI